MLARVPHEKAREFTWITLFSRFNRDFNRLHAHWWRTIMGRSMANSGYCAPHGVLIVDGRGQCNKLLRAILATLGVTHIVTHATGAEALAGLRVESYDVVFCGEDNIGMNPVAFLRALRRDATSQNREVPVILVSAHLQRRQVELLRDCGANDVLITPTKRGRRGAQTPFGCPRAAALHRGREFRRAGSPLPRRWFRRQGTPARNAARSRCREWRTQPQRSALADDRSRFRCDQRRALQRWRCISCTWCGASGSPISARPSAAIAARHRMPAM